MRSNPRSVQHNGSRPGPFVQLLQLPDAHGRRPHSVSAAGNLRSGTIDTVMRAADEQFFGEQSETVTRGLPLAAAPRPAVSGRIRPQLCAKDLIAELDSINSQIHRMMFQVERAVARLAASG